jgi:hypothetical protein
MFRGPESNILLVNSSIQMEMSLIGEPCIVENTLFMSCPSGKMQPLFFVMVSKIKSPVPLMLFSSIYSNFAALAP